MKNKTEEFDRTHTHRRVREDRISFPLSFFSFVVVVFAFSLSLVCLFARDRGRRSLVVPTTNGVVLMLVSNSYKQKRPHTGRRVSEKRPARKKRTCAHAFDI